MERIPLLLLRTERTQVVHHVPGVGLAETVVPRLHHQFRRHAVPDDVVDLAVGAAVAAIPRSGAFAFACHAAGWLDPSRSSGTPAHPTKSGEKTLVIDQGKVAFFGSPEEAAQTYLDRVGADYSVDESLYSQLDHLAPELNP